MCGCTPSIQCPACLLRLQQALGRRSGGARDDGDDIPRVIIKCLVDEINRSLGHASDRKLINLLIRLYAEIKALMNVVVSCELHNFLSQQ